LFANMLALKSHVCANVSANNFPLTLGKEAGLNETTHVIDDGREKKTPPKGGVVGVQCRKVYISSFTLAMMPSAVMPNFSNNCSAGADAPKRSIPTKPVLPARARSPNNH
jgi:hypothetical protein